MSRFQHRSSPTSNRPKPFLKLLSSTQTQPGYRLHGRVNIHARSRRSWAQYRPAPDQTSKIRHKATSSNLTADRRSAPNIVKPSRLKAFSPRPSDLPEPPRLPATPRRPKALRITVQRRPRRQIPDPRNRRRYGPAASTSPRNMRYPQSPITL